jgi:2'-5' RNA ligase
MAASASLLDDVHADRVREVWGSLQEDHGLSGVSVSPVPHLSYQCARDFDIALLNEIVEKVAAKARPLKVRTAGLGIFPGPSPVIYIPVVRSPELTRLQLALWSAGAVACEKPLAEYHPAAWIPHITIAQGDVTVENLGPVIHTLNGVDLMWELEVDNLAIVRGRGDKPQEVVGRHPFTGGSARNF